MIKSHTDIEQSKKLAEILPFESADMYWKNGVSDKYIQCVTPFVTDDYRSNVNFDYDVPCWSLAALLDILKDKIIFGSNTPEGWFCCYTVKSPIRTLTIYRDSLVDACYEMIIKLDELNLLKL